MMGLRTVPNTGYQIGGKFKSESGTRVTEGGADPRTITCPWVRG